MGKYVEVWLDDDQLEDNEDYIDAVDDIDNYLSIVERQITLGLDVDSQQTIIQNINSILNKIR